MFHRFVSVFFCPGFYRAVLAPSGLDRSLSELGVED